MTKRAQAVAWLDGPSGNLARHPERLRRVTFAEALVTEIAFLYALDQTDGDLVSLVMIGTELCACTKSIDWLIQHIRANATRPDVIAVIRLWVSKAIFHHDLYDQFMIGTQRWEALTRGKIARCYVNLTAAECLEVVAPGHFSLTVRTHDAATTVTFTCGQLGAATFARHNQLARAVFEEACRQLPPTQTRYTGIYRKRNLAPSGLVLTGCPPATSCYFEYALRQIADKLREWLDWSVAEFERCFADLVLLVDGHQPRLI